jgi:hypothetical protein
MQPRPCSERPSHGMLLPAFAAIVSRPRTPTHRHLNPLCRPRQRATRSAALGRSHLHSCIPTLALLPQLLPCAGMRVLLPGSLPPTHAFYCP